jgi:predicted metal-dependent hydrolase
MKESMVDITTSKNSKPLNSNKVVKITSTIKLGQKDGQESDFIEVKVRKNIKAHCIGIRISRKRMVELIVPKKEDFSKAQAFLLQKENWIRNQLADLTKSVSAGKPKIPDAIPIFDKIHKIILNVKGLDEAIAIANDQVLVSYLLVGAEDVLFAITIYLQSMAELRIGKYARQIAENLGIKYNKISVREAADNWGCCREGNLFFAWRLIFAPEYVMKYVVTRELCSLVEKRKSNRFMILLDKIYPANVIAQLWLKKYEKSLYSVFGGNVGIKINKTQD